MQSICASRMMGRNVVNSVYVEAAPRIAVDYAGQGELLILLHGIGGNKRNWRDTVSGLSDAFHVVAWDARGWGDSDDYNGPLTFDDMANDLLRVIKWFKAERAHILGLSMGGRIAMHFVEKYPDSVASLVLCDTTCGIAGWSDEQRIAFLDSRRAPLLAGQSMASVAETVGPTLVSPTSGPDALAQIIDSMLRLRKENYLKAIELNLMTPAHNRLDEITVPTLVIVGEKDTLTPPDDARAIAGQIKGAEFVVIPGAGHLTNIEAPIVFNATVREFLLKHTCR